MDPISLLASSLGRNDEEPNIELAHAIVGRDDVEAVASLVDALGGKAKAVRSDAIKVLYEIGEKNPDLITPYAATFVNLTSSRENRLVWGAMSALDAIADVDPDAVAGALPTLHAAASVGSVITNDRYTSILAKLNAYSGHRETVFPLLLAQLQRAPINQLPMYAEFAAGTISPDQIPDLTARLTERLEDVPQETKRRRIVKVLRDLGKVAASS